MCLSHGLRASATPTIDSHSLTPRKTSGTNIFNFACLFWGRAHPSPSVLRLWAKLFVWGRGEERLLEPRQ